MMRNHMRVSVGPGRANDPGSLAGQDGVVDARVELRQLRHRELVGAVYEFMAPQAEAWRGAGAFGPAVDVSKDADAQERLLAITGRRPST